MATCRTGRYPIHFGESGRGLPVILIHGHAVDLRVWDDVVPLLVQAGLRVIRYDIRGHGQSFAPEDGYGLDDYVDDLRSLTAHVGVEETVLAGFSMGGEIAVAYAERFPARVAALVLVCSALDGVVYSNEFYAGIERLQTSIRANGVHPTIEDEFPKHAFFDHLRGNGDAMDKVHAMMAVYAGREYLVDLEASQRPTVELLGHVTAPTLVLSADGDVPDLRLVSTLLREGIPGAEYREFEGAGHMLPMERPAGVADAVVDFARRRARSPLRPA